MNNTIHQVLQSTTAHLREHSDSARLDAEILLAFVIQKPRSWMYTWPDTIITDEQREKLDSLVAERQSNTPIAYLTGYRDFWSIRLKVTKDTLIPRPETEMLVELTLKSLENIPNARILDAGTGSGALALALARERPDFEITACDNSVEALKIARENAQNLGLNWVSFHHSDWFSSLPKQQYHAIISNPPYIAEGDPHLSQGDIRFEPRGALISKQNGFQDLKHLIEKSPEWLMPGGILLLEHGFEQKLHISSILSNAGYENIRCWQDLQGLDRISRGVWNS